MQLRPDVQVLYASKHGYLMGKPECVSLALWTLREQASTIGLEISLDHCATYRRNLPVERAAQDLGFTKAPIRSRRLWQTPAQTSTGDRASAGETSLWRS
jgi:hypothetical protein